MFELKIKGDKSRGQVAALDGILQAFGAHIGDGGTPGVYLTDADGYYEVRVFGSNSWFPEQVIASHGFEIVSKRELSE